MTFRPIPATPLLILILCLLAYCKTVQDSSDELAKELAKVKLDISDSLDSSYQDCQRIRAVDRDIYKKSGCLDVVELLCEERAKKPMECIDELKNTCGRIGE